MFVFQTHIKSCSEFIVHAYLHHRHCTNIILFTHYIIYIWDENGRKMKAQCSTIVLFYYCCCTIAVLRLTGAVSQRHEHEQDDATADVHPCQRECRVDEPPKTCEYHFKVEWYYTMSKACYDCPYNMTDCYRPDCVPADGVAKPIIVINRSLPGPSIQVIIIMLYYNA